MDGGQIHTGDRHSTAPPLSIDEARAAQRDAQPRTAPDRRAQIDRAILATRGNYAQLREVEAEFTLATGAGWRRWAVIKGKGLPS